MSPIVTKNIHWCDSNSGPPLTALSVVISRVKEGKQLIMTHVDADC